MYTAIVTYALPKPVPRDVMLEGFKAAEQRFRSLPQLIRKYFCYDEANHTGHSVYLWETHEAATAFFNEDFTARFIDRFGATPEFFIVDTLMVVDNAANETITLEKGA